MLRTIVESPSFLKYLGGLEKCNLLSSTHSFTASRVKEAEHDVEHLLESNIGK